MHGLDDGGDCSEVRVERSWRIEARTAENARCHLPPFSPDFSLFLFFSFLFFPLASALSLFLV